MGGQIAADLYPHLHAPHPRMLPGNASTRSPEPGVDGIRPIRGLSERSWTQFIPFVDHQASPPNGGFALKAREVRRTGDDVDLVTYHNVGVFPLRWQGTTSPVGRHDVFGTLPSSYEVMPTGSAHAEPAQLNRSERRQLTGARQRQSHSRTGTRFASCQDVRE